MRFCSWPVAPPVSDGACFQRWLCYPRIAVPLLFVIHGLHTAAFSFIIMISSYRNSIYLNGYEATATLLPGCGACKVSVRANGFRVTSNILLSAMPSARELETQLVRFDVSLDANGCSLVLYLLRELYRGPPHSKCVLSVAENVTYQGKTPAIQKMETDFGLFRVDNFVYIYNPWNPAN